MSDELYRKLDERSGENDPKRWYIWYCERCGVTHHDGETCATPSSAPPTCSVPDFVDEAEGVLSLLEGASELKALLERAAVLKAVDDEPELPGDMPDEMWAAIAGDRDAMAEALRIVVRKTKDGIRERIAAL